MLRPCPIFLLALLPGLALAQPRPHLDSFGFALPDGARARMGSMHFRQQAAVNAAAIAPDGTHAALAGENGIVSIWDLDSARKRRDLIVGQEVHALAWGEGGTLATLGRAQNTRVATLQQIIIWNTKTGAATARFHISADKIVAIGFDAQGKLLGARVSDKQLLLVNIVAQRETGTLSLVRAWDFTDPFCRITFTPDTRTLVTHHQGRVRLFEVASGRESATFQPDLQVDGEHGLGLACTNDRSRVALCGSPGTLTIYDVATGKSVHDLKQQRASALAFSGDGASLLAGSKHFLAQLWDVASGKELHAPVGHSATMGAVAISADGKVVATAAYDQTVRLWDAATGRPLHVFRITTWAHCLLFTPDSQSLICAGREGCTPTMTDIRTGKVRRSFQGVGTDYIHNLAWSADGSQLLGYSGSSSTLYTWDLASGRLENRRLVKSWRDGWEARHGTKPPPLAWTGEQAPLQDLSPGGRLALAWQQDPNKYWKLGVHDAATGRRWRDVGAVHSWSPRAHGMHPQFSSDGRTIFADAISSILPHQFGIAIFETASGRERRTLYGYGSRVTACAVTPDGRYLATIGDQEPALVWNLHGGTPDAPSTDRPSKRLELIWEFLGRVRPEQVSGSVAECVAGGDATVAFLDERLAPVPQVAEDRIRKWLAELDHPSFVVRKAADKSLLALGEASEPWLVKALADPSSLEAKRRLEGLVKRIAEEHAKPTPEQIRVCRALEALERINTPAARGLVARLAQGMPTAPLTLDARETLTRMIRKARP